MDGIDVALIKTDGQNMVEFGPTAAFEFDADMRQNLTQAMQTATQIKHRDERPDNLSQIEAEITSAHARAVESSLQQNNLTDSDIDIIGFHGQTVLHRPQDQLTVQLGDGKALAKALHIDVVYDLRAADVAAGGQGAPLVPVFHQALASQIETRPLAFVNIGGISNITYINKHDEITAFDCGPGNAMLDDWVLKHTGQAFDKDGEFARTGQLNEQVLHDYMVNPYFNQPVPKSLDRFDFILEGVEHLSPADGARTLVEITAKSIANAAQWFAQPPQDWIICGGGRCNKFLMSRIAANVQGIVTPAEAHSLEHVEFERVQAFTCRDEAGVALANPFVAGSEFISTRQALNGDAMEAQAFAYLAVRSLKKLPLTFPMTTGVEKALTGGVLCKEK